MKRFSLFAVIMLLCISMIAVFSFAGCKAEETAEEEMTEEETTEPVEEEEAVEEKPEEESRVTRFFRNMLQWAIISIVLVAIGAALTFFLLYQPTKQQLETAQTDLQSTQEELDQTESDLSEFRSDLEDTEESLQQTEEELQDATNRIHFLRLVNNVTRARFALSQQEGAAARLALLDAQTQLEKVLPMVEQRDPELATLLEVRLERAINNLGGDPETAESDLNTLSQDMMQLEEILFSEE